MRPRIFVPYFRGSTGVERNIAYLTEKLRELEGKIGSESRNIEIFRIIGISSMGPAGESVRGYSVTTKFRGVLNQD